MAKKDAEPLPPPEPPPSLPARAVEVWHEVVASNDLAGNVDRAALEAFCTLLARLREARERVNSEGMVVEDKRGRVVPHPALAVERQAAEDIRAWGDRFAPLVKPARQRGYMADATARSIAAATHLQGPKFAGAIAAVKTLAWLIDEAQRDSMSALQRTATSAGAFPIYLKACAELRISPAALPVGTPASAPPAATVPAAPASVAAASEPAKPGGKGNVTSFLDRARDRRGDRQGGDEATA